MAKVIHRLNFDILETVVPANIATYSELMQTLNSVILLDYTVGQKRAYLFLSVTLSKSTDFSAVFTVRFGNKRHMRRAIV